MAKKRSFSFGRNLRSKTTISGRHMQSAIEKSVEKVVPKSRSRGKYRTGRKGKKGGWSLTLDETDKQLSRKIRKAMKSKIRDRVFDMLEIIAAEALLAIRNEIAAELEGSAIFNDLLNGELGAEYGVDDEVLRLFENNLEKVFQVVIDQEGSKSDANKINFTLSLEIKPYPKPEDLMNESIGFAYYSNNNLIPWLNNLLYGEGKVVAPNYSIIDKQGFGRTNMKIMVQTNGKDYTLKSDLAGSEHDNWMRDTIIDMFSELQDIFQEIFVNNVKRTFKS